MTIFRTAACALLASMVSGCASEYRATEFVEKYHASDTIDLPSNYTLGGSLKAYAWKAQKIIESGKTLRITQPVCFSACTYFLAAHKLCVSPATQFKFHSARNGYVAALTLVPVADRHANEVVAQDLNNRWPGLGDAFLRNAGDKLIIGDVWTQTGAELNTKYGVPLCEGDTQ